MTDNLLQGTRFGALDVLFTAEATEHDGWNFPRSMNRSARVEKKLLKRFGGRERRKPCMYKIAGKIVAHPTFEAELRKIGIVP